MNNGLLHSATMRSTEINCHLYSSSNNSPKLQIHCINFVLEAYTFSEKNSVFYKKTSILPWGTVIFFIYHKIKNFKKQYLPRIPFYVTKLYSAMYHQQKTTPLGGRKLPTAENPRNRSMWLLQRVHIETKVSYDFVIYNKSHVYTGFKPAKF